MVKEELVKRIKANLDRYGYAGDEYFMELRASELRELIDYPFKDKGDDLPEELNEKGEAPWSD
jgi:hypothetical protein